MSVEPVAQTARSRDPGFSQQLSSTATAQSDIRTHCQRACRKKDGGPEEPGAAIEFRLRTHMQTPDYLPRVVVANLSGS